MLRRSSCGSIYVLAQCGSRIHLSVRKTLLLHGIRHRYKTLRLSSTASLNRSTLQVWNIWPYLLSDVLPHYSNTLGPAVPHVIDVAHGKLDYHCINKFGDQVLPRGSMRILLSPFMKVSSIPVSIVFKESPHLTMVGLSTPSCSLSTNIVPKLTWRVFLFSLFLIWVEKGTI